MRRLTRCFNKRLVSFLLTIAMIAGEMMSNGLMLTARADMSAPVSQQNVSAQSVNGINLGKQTTIKKGDGTIAYSFGNAVVNYSGSGIRSMMVMLPYEGDTACTINLPSGYSQFTVNNETDDYKIINIAAGTSVQDVQNYIRNITFSFKDDVMQDNITFVIGETEIKEKLYYNYDNQHFYQYVDNKMSWTDAYKAAKSTYVFNTQGHLYVPADVQFSEHEYSFLYKNVLNEGEYNGWIGVTRLKYNASQDTFDKKSAADFNSTVAYASPYYALDGRGNNVLFRYSTVLSKKYNSFSGLFSAFDRFHAFTDHCYADLYIWQVTWNHEDPYEDYRYYEPVWDKGKSCVMLRTKYGKSGLESGSWVTESESGSTTDYNYGYFVEYGIDYKSDSTWQNAINATSAITPATKMMKPYMSIDYINEVFTGFEAGKSYLLKVDGIETDMPSISDDGTVAIQESWMGQMVSFAVKGNGETTIDSDYYEINVPSRPGVPIGIKGDNRTLAGLTSSMEYKAENDDEWTPVTTSVVQKLKAGRYCVRVAATTSSFKSGITEIEVTKGGATYELNVNKKVDVALAIGTTSVDYSDFENDLRGCISRLYPEISQDNLNIMATQAVDVSSQNNFKWLQFDHSSKTNSNTFSQVYTESSGNLYGDKDNHIVSEENGTKLTFYGYGSPSYADFMLLENDQQTKKSFSFDIKEYFAADALYGTGFFFNCNMKYSNSYSTKEAAYKAHQLLMDGYLMVIEYNGSSAAGVSIYQFTDLNLYNFHNASASINSVLDGLKNNGATVTQLSHVNASSTVSAGHFSYGTAFRTSDDLRRFRVDVTPTSVKVYYIGYDDPYHDVAMTKDEKHKYNTANEPISSFNKDEMEKFDNKKFPENDNDIKSYLLISAELNEMYGGSDFGPMTKYGSHGCERLTKVEYSNLSMTMEQVKSLTETLRQPEWNNNTEKFLINLNEDPINDFDSPSITAELLNRLQNDDIYYIGWCSSKNSDKSLSFLKKNDLKGSIIDVASTSVAINKQTYNVGNTVDLGDERTYTISSKYDAQIVAIANAIYERYAKSSGNKDVVLLDSEKNVTISKADVTNTADEYWPNGKWRIDYYDSVRLSDDSQPVTSEWMSDYRCDFDKTGTYKIYYAALSENEDGVADEPLKTVVVHTAPTVSFTSAIDTSAKKINLVSNSYDPDGDDELKYEWKYCDLSGSNATEKITLSSTGNTAEITNLVDGHMYLVTLTVTDSYGASNIYSLQVNYSSQSSSQAKVAPVAFFTLDKSMVITSAGSDGSINITDTSYDPQADTITSRAYTLYKPDGTTMELSPDASGKVVISKTLTTGKYSIGLVVKSANGTSTEVKRYFNIVQDNKAPEASASLAEGVLARNNNKVTLSFKDEGGSGFKNYKITVTDSENTPEDTEWNVPSTDTSSDVTFKNENGSYYIHYIIEDNAGNTKAGYFGPYVREDYIDTPYDLSWDAEVTPVISWKGDSRIGTVSGTEYVINIYKNGKIFDRINTTDTRYTVPAIVRSGEGEYTFTVQAVDNEYNTYSSSIAKSPAFNYKKPDGMVNVKGGKLNISSGNITQDDLDEVFGGYAEIVSDKPLTIRINGDVELDEPLEIYEDPVTEDGAGINIDLNGHEFKGKDGDEESPDGKAAITAGSDNIDINIKGDGEVSGGNGYNGETGGNGGNAIDFKNTTGCSFSNGPDASVIGGNGGTGSESTGGNGGNAIAGNGNTDVTGSGSLKGGDGGNGATAGGNGGNGVDLAGGNVTINQPGYVGGGNGGSGDKGGNGGNGIDHKGNNPDDTVTIRPGTNVEGGIGGNGNYGNGGNGGTAADTNYADINNKGNLAGGNGGSSSNGAGGNGGSGARSENGNIISLIKDPEGGSGGIGADGTAGNSGDSRHDSGETGTGAGGNLDITQPDFDDLSQKVDNGEMSEDEAAKLILEAQKKGQEKADQIFGKGNTTYDVETNTIILNKDVELEDTVEIPSDINIDLNGQKITGPDGTKDLPDGKPAIKVTGDDVDLGITDSSEAKGGSIQGGNGASGGNTSTGGSSEAGNGAPAIDYGTGNGKLDIGEGTNISGGNGGDSSTGSAGDGGNAVDAPNADINLDGSASGGNGGSGNTYGGNGGAGVNSGNGNVNINENGQASGGNGGSGNVGGNGGNGITADGSGSQPGSGNGKVNVNPSAGVSGGNGGTGITGAGGNGGNAVESTNKDVDIPDGTANPGNGGTGKTESGNAGQNSSVKNKANGGELRLDDLYDDTKTPEEIQDILDNVFGAGNTSLIKDEETGNIIIDVKNNVELDNPLVIIPSQNGKNDITFNLNGNTIKGPDGTKHSPDGKPAIKVDGNNVNITIEDNGTGGGISGGNGYSNKGTDNDGKGGNGASAIDFGNSENSSLDVAPGATVSGGKGGDAVYGPAGNGGSAISSDVSSDTDKDKTLDITIGGNVSGGNGGYSAKGEGGNGGSAVAAPKADIKVPESGTASSGNGGNSGASDANAGNGGSVFDGDDQNIDVSGRVNPGNGGTNSRNDNNNGSSSGISSGSGSQPNFNVITDNKKDEDTKTSFKGPSTVRVGEEFEGKLDVNSKYADNSFVSKPDNVTVTINGKEQDVDVVTEEWDESNKPDKITYNKKTGDLYIPADMVTGSVSISAEPVIPESCEVTDDFAKDNNKTVEDVIKDALIAGVEDIDINTSVKMDEDITIPERSNVTVKEGNTISPNGNTITIKGSLTVEGDVDYSNGGKFILPDGTVINEHPKSATTKNSTVYDESHTIKVDNNTIESVTINGKETAFDENGRIDLTENGRYVIRIKDKIGDEITYIIRVLGKDEVNGLREETIDKEKTYIYGVGEINFKVDNKANSFTGSVVNSKTTIEAILDKDSRDMVSKGSLVQIRTVIDDSQDVINPDEAAGIQADIDNSQYSSYINAGLFDITLNYKIDDSDWMKCTDPTDKVRIILNVPEQLKGLDAEYVVARYHDGEVTYLEDLDDSADTITIETDKFSTYAVLYKINDSGQTDYAVSAATGDNMLVMPFAILMMISLIGIAGVILNKKRRIL